jgi:hypothetical protein
VAPPAANKDEASAQVAIDIRVRQRATRVTCGATASQIGLVMPQASSRVANAHLAWMH